MAEYYLNVNGNLQKSQTINLTIDANTAYATVCWVGTVVNSGDCISDVSETYCESVYVGINTPCSPERLVSGTTYWHSCRITYKITQSENTNCDNCGDPITTCELIDAYVSPYYVPSSSTTTTVFYQYWETVKDDCKVLSRKRRFGSKEVTLSPRPSTIPCTAETISDRTVGVGDVEYCGGTISGLTCYVEKPENCCDHDDNDACYEINDIFYSPQKVDASGGTVDFFFDYKKTTYKDCKKKYSYGRFQDSIYIDECIDNACCKERVKTIPYIWNGHTLCNGGNTVNLNILGIFSNNSR